MPSNPLTGAAAPIKTKPLPAGATALTGVPSGPPLVNPALTPAPSSGPTGPGGGPDTGPGGAGGGTGSGPGGGPTGTGPGSGGPGTGPGGGPDGGGGGTGGGPGGGGTGGGGAGGGGAGGGPGGAPSPSPGPGGTGTTGQTDSSGDVGTKMNDSLLGLIENATSADALEAQNIILRRIALQGDVVPSRVPPPKNITEIGGYLNLLTTLKQTDMQSQVLAGILGVAGPNPPLGWTTSVTPLAFVPLANDRPAGPAQPTLPVTIQIRSDFADTLRAALKTLHDQGCVLPLLGTPATLPMSGFNSQAPGDVLPYLGRVLLLAANTALVAPATDVLLLARNQGSSGPFQVAANALGTATVAVAPANFEALACTTSACTPAALTGAKLVYVAPVLANAGFYSAAPLPQPATSADTAWARFTNITGLVAGSTRLGDELSLIYSWTTIGDSVFAGMLGWIWNGTAFAPPS